jgi:hypothetical protein
MDLGPQWPFWLQLGAAATGAVLLSWLAVRHARGSKGWLQTLTGLALWTVLVCVAWALQGPLCHVGWRLAVEIAGCDWEYHRAPSEAGALAQFIVLGALSELLRLGPPAAGFAFIVGVAFWRFRPAAEPGVAADSQPE